MKIVRNITISPEEYFTALIEGVIKSANAGLEQGDTPYTEDDLINGTTMIRNKHNVFKKDRYTVDTYVPNKSMTGHISSVIEESTFEYEIIPLGNGGCTVNYTAFVTKKLEKPKSKPGQMWAQALTLSKMANEIIDIETAVNRKKYGGSGHRPF